MSRRLLPWLLLTLCTARVAVADGRQFNIDHVQLAITSDEFVATEGRALGPPWSWRLGAGLVITDRPLVLDLDGARSDLVASRSLLDLTASLPLPLGFTVGADLPVLIYQTGTAVDHTAGLGDLRLVGRYDFIGSPRFVAAMLFELRLPLATSTSFLGEGTLIFEPRLALGFKWGPVRGAINIGLRLREERVYRDLDVQHEILSSAAVAVRPHRWPWIEGFAELHADTAFSGAGFTTAQSPVELLLGLGGRWRGWHARAAIGLGLVAGIGDPVMRGIVSILYTLPRSPVAAPPGVTDGAWDSDELTPPPHAESDAASPHVKVSADLLRLAEPLRFERDSADIAPEQIPILDELAAAIDRRPWIKTVWILGPVDDSGSASLSFQLSELRAQRIAGLLVERGVQASRLRTLKFGETRPWFNDTQERERTIVSRSGATFFIERAPSVRRPALDRPDERKSASPGDAVHTIDPDPVMGVPR